MLAATDAVISRLIVVNVLLGVACLVLVLVVAGGVVYELVVRRRIRASLPKGWPPDQPPARRIRRTAALPDRWPPQVEEPSSARPEGDPR